MSRKQLNIGLFGFGCVGLGLYEVLEKTPGFKAGIKKICVKDKNKPRVLPDECFTYDKNDILDDNNINVVVELIDDADAAFEIVSAALKKGKAVVSANKKMIAQHFSELLLLQKQYNVPLLYEGACCASIPIIRNLEEYYDNDLLESVEGIVNGSTNYILTKTSAENLSYNEALKQAQEMGFAESNPVLDTGGFDAKFKLLLLLAHSFGYVCLPDDIFNLGIDTIGELELKYAREKGYKIKLVAQAFKNPDGRLTAFVMPKFINREDRLFNVDDVFNGIITKSGFADTQFFVGRGAGAYPTASAVLSDISALSYDYRYEYKKIYQQEKQLQLSDNVTLKILLRYNDGKPDVLRNYFITIHEQYNSYNSGYITGEILLTSIKELYNNISNISCILIDIAVSNKINSDKTLQLSS